MKVAVFEDRHTIKIREMPIPEIQDNEVLVRVMACGICGTDVHIYEGDKGAAEVSPPVILGHEFSGIIERTGKNVKHVEIGERVCVDPNILCNSCVFCQKGIGHFCKNMKGIGTTANGGFAQFCAVPESAVHILDETVSFNAGAMSEPLSCCIHGIDLCEIELGSKVMILGGGFIGLLMLQLVSLSGASQVILVEPVEKKRLMAQKLGADITISPQQLETQQFSEFLQKENLDVVIECVGKTDTVKQAIKYAGKKGTVLLFGLTKPEDEVEIKPFELFQKELTIRASYINPYTMQRALDLINQGKIEVDSLIEEVCGLEELDAILKDSHKRSQGKYIIAPWN